MTVSDASDEAQDLRATAEDLIRDAERVQAIEEQKLELPADDPKMVDLARESERIVQGMLPKAISETELAEDVSTESDPTQ